MAAVLFFTFIAWLVFADRNIPWMYRHQRDRCYHKTGCEACDQE